MSKNWVKLQVEPVEVCVDGDESLLFSTVQSVVPGAHGLYYREGGQRKALSFDTNTGRVFAPATGWNAQNIYVHLAHGSKHGVHYADYNKASAQFEKNVSAVQKLIASAGLSYGLRPLHRGEKPGRSRSKVKSGFEAQPENVHISDESDSHALSQSPTAADNAKQLIAENEELKLQLKEVKRNLKDQKKELDSLKRTSTGEVAPVIDNSRNEEFERLQRRNAELESLVSKKDVQHGEISASDKTVNSSSDELAMLEAVQAEQAELIRNKDDHIHSVVSQLEEAKAKIQELTEKEDEINNLHTVIEDLREKLIASQKEKIENCSELAEHKELLKNAKDKVAYLENQVNILNGGSDQLVIERPHGSISPRPRSRNTSESHDEPSKAQIRAVETKLQVANNALRTCEADKQKLQEANWYANERVAKLEKETGYLKGQNEELRNRLQSSSSANLVAERDQMISELAEQRARLEWRIGELSQWWNDSKWKVGELEAGVAHQRYLLDTANGKIQSLNEHTPQAPSTSFNPTYALRQNYGQWQLANSALDVIPAAVVPASYLSSQFAQNIIHPQPETKRVLLEIENPDHKEVFMRCSLLNWQCALRCDVDRSGKSGVVLDMPKGRHEFRFLIEGNWVTSSDFPTVPNGLGGLNNLIFVE